MNTEESSFLIALLEGFDGSYALLDQDLSFLAAGQTFLALTGLERNGLVNQPLAALLPGLKSWLNHLIQNFGAGLSQVEWIRFSVSEPGTKAKRHLKARAQVVASVASKDQIKGIILQV
ncbi:MAG: hypothetical protein AAF804_03365, partial [Bacteroidota bacterium]